MSFVQAPSSETQDKILFMINNISTSNMDAKAKEFGEILKEQYYPWFAQYMVMKRWKICLITSFGISCFHIDHQNFELFCTPV